MSLEQLIEVFILLFIGMGPVKVLLVYIELTSGLEATVKRQMARRVTTVAGTVALRLCLLWEPSSNSCSTSLSER